MTLKYEPSARALTTGNYPDTKSRRSRSGEITLRVIEYSLPGVPQAEQRYRLLTTLLDHARIRAPAAARAAQRGSFSEQLSEPAPPQPWPHWGERPRIRAGVGASGTHVP